MGKHDPLGLVLKRQAGGGGFVLEFANPPNHYCVQFEINSSAGTSNTDASPSTPATLDEVREPIERGEQESIVTYPLCWSGQFHTDSYQDGTYTIRWRVRLLDYDMANGEIVSQMPQASYRLDR